MEQTKDLENIRGEITERAQEFAAKATEFAKENPHAAVGIALGIGWVLGNGLPPRVVMIAARMGWKAMLGSALASGGLANLFGDEDEGEQNVPMTRRGTARAESDDAPVPSRAAT